MADEILAFFNPANHITIHDLHVINIKKHLDAIGSDATQDACHVVHVVALIARMAFHRVAAVAGVQLLEADRHSLLLRMAGDLLEALHAVVGPLRSRDLAALGIICIPPLVAIEGNHCWKTGVGASVNHLCGADDHLVLVTRIIKPPHKRRTGHAIGGYCAAQAMLLDRWPVLGVGQFDRGAAELLGDLTHLFNVPLVASRGKAPVHNRLVDATLLCC